MEKFYVYILYSPQCDKYYIGATRLDPEVRLERHLEAYYGKSKYTKHINDWEIFYTIECQNFGQALKIENHIMRMKSRVYLENLTKYPEIISKLLEKYE